MNPQTLDPFRGGLLYHLLSMNHAEEKRVFWERTWNTYTLEQKRVIARFLEYIAVEVAEHRQDARLTWRCYWHQFSPSPTP